jgi:uncharacterized protein
MRLIDSHIHLFDIYTGLPVSEWRQEIPFGLLSIYEGLGFRRPGGRNKESGRWLGDWGFVESCRRMQAGHLEACLRSMDQNGIERSIVMPIAPQVTTDQILEVCGKTDRLIPFASVDARRPDAAERLQGYVRRGCRGLKIHPVLQAIEPCSPELMNVLEAFRPFNLPVCIHAGPCRAGIIPSPVETYAHPRRIEPLVRAFPEINFILAHMGLIYSDDVIEIAARQGNVFLDVSFQPAVVLKEAERRLGSERLIFGSDFPLLKPSSVIRVVRKAFERNEEALHRVFFRNISTLLRLDESS